MDIPRNTSSDSSALESLGKLFVTLACLPITICTRAWAVSTLWNWFVAPQFALPRLTILTAVGFTMAVSLITFDLGKAMNEAAKSDDEWGLKLAKSVIGALIFYPVAVGFGWVVHLFY